MKIKFLLLATLFSQIILAQFTNLNYNWETAPKSYTPSNDDKTHSQITLLRKNIIELVIENNEPYEYNITHRKTYVNTDEAVERNNKIYINTQDEQEILANKIRIILPDGKITEISEKNIKEAEDEETGKKFKYFALDGLVKGSVLEHLLIRKEEPDLSGAYFKLQDDFPIKEAYFEIIHPDFLIFDVKVLNNNQNVKTTNLGEKVSHKLELKNLIAIPDEKYSNPEANKTTLLYKLSGNKASKTKNLFGYEMFSETINKITNTKLEDSENYLLNDFASKIQLGKNEEENIRIIEDYVKENIGYEERYGNGQNLQEIISNKVSGQGGFLKIFAQLFNKYHIDFETVFTSDRFKVKFDNNYENYAYLDDVLFYFPKYNKYMDGTALIYRYPLYSPNNANNHGVFIKKPNSNPSYEVKKIPENPVSYETHKITADFSKSVTEPEIHTLLSYDGISASQLQPISDLVPAENLSSVKTDIAKNYTGFANDAKVEFINPGFENLGKKPFKIDVLYNGENHIEKAGNKIVFKFGELIGKQVEMYQEGNRILPVEIPFVHHYDRTITIIIPEGYQVKNLEKIDANYEVNMGGKKVAYFTTTHKSEGNKIIINNKEVYEQVEFPTSVYNNYIKVINAAADFNKLSLIFEKK